MNRPTDYVVPYLHTQPNCRSSIVMNGTRILIFAARDIVAGEELTYDYKVHTQTRTP